MKKTALEKNKALKLMGQMQKAAIPGRFAQGSAALPDRREQRKIDQAAGLVPFAVKLPQDLVRQLNEQAAQQGISVHELTARVLQAGLGEAVAASPSASTTSAASKPAASAPVSPAAKKAAAKKASIDTAAAPKPPAKKAAAKKAAKAS